MSLDEAIDITERIDRGINDQTTRDHRFAALWRHPFLREEFLALLHIYNTDSDQTGALRRHNFDIICALLDPPFAAIWSMIDLPDAILTSATTVLYEDSESVAGINV